MWQQAWLALAAAAATAPGARADSAAAAGTESTNRGADLFGPASWGAISIAIWLLYAVARGWSGLGKWDRQQLFWGVFSALAFCNFLQRDTDFQGWGDVYFFCGRQLEYCNCNFRWNVYGWVKATVLWNFVLTAALGAQRLAIQVGLNGLLPGEEVVTKESFISICWRLIPYWLNNWEQQWGAECSSMMFELPHFAVELLVILPCVQILCSRMKILAMPLVNMAPHGAPAPAGQQGPQGGGQQGQAQGQGGFVREHYAPNILKGYWEHRPEQKDMMPRLRANLQIMLFTVVITSLAAFNALYVPLHLERQIGFHPHMLPIQMAGRQLPWDQLRNVTKPPSTQLLTDAGIWAPEHRDVVQGRFAWYLGVGTPQLERKTGTGADAAIAISLARGAASALDVVGAAGGGGAAMLLQQLGLRGVLGPSALSVAGPLVFDRKNSASVDSMDSSIVSIMNNWANNTTGASEAAAAAFSGDDTTAAAALEAEQETEGTTAAASEQVSPVVLSPRCGTAARLVANLRKHSDEIFKMQDPEHMALIPLVESALAVMRLSCEKYFVLVSVFVSYLLFREPPRAARALIRLNSRLSTAFQKIILYSFPAVCWVYGAGFVFSTFVSVVFWGGPLMQAYQAVRAGASIVRIRALRPATSTDVERMGGNCAICWGEMVVAAAEGTAVAGAAGGGAAAAVAAAAAAAAAAVTAGVGAGVGAGPQPPAPAIAGHTDAAPPLVVPAAMAPAPAPQPAAGAGAGAANGPQQQQPQQLQQPQQPPERPLPPPRQRRSTDGADASAAEQGPIGAGPGLGAAPGAMPAPEMDATTNGGETDPVAAASGSPGSADAGEGYSLPCSHAYHYACLHQWLHQCHAQGTTPTCPMCQAAIQLEVKWQLPLPWQRRPADAVVAAAGDDDGGHLLMNPNGANHPEDLQMLGLLDHQRELQEMLRDMPQILPPEGVMAVPEAPAPQHQAQLAQLAAERQNLLAERQQLLERRRALQHELGRQQQELVRLREAQAAVARQEQELQAVEGQLRRQLEELHQRGGGGADLPDMLGALEGGDGGAAAAAAGLGMAAGPMLVPGAGVVRALGEGHADQRAAAANGGEAAGAGLGPQAGVRAGEELAGRSSRGPAGAHDGAGASTSASAAETAGAGAALAPGADLHGSESSAHKWRRGGRKGSSSTGHDNAGTAAAVSAAVGAGAGGQVGPSAGVGTGGVSAASGQHGARGSASAPASASSLGAPVAPRGSMEKATQRGGASGSHARHAGADCSHEQGAGGDDPSSSDVAGTSARSGAGPGLAAAAKSTGAGQGGTGGGAGERREAQRTSPAASGPWLWGNNGAAAAARQAGMAAGASPSWNSTATTETNGPPVAAAGTSGGAAGAGGSRQGAVDVMHAVPAANGSTSRTAAGGDNAAALAGAPGAGAPGADAGQRRRLFFFRRKK